jgi:hypothetical protein
LPEVGDIWRCDPSFKLTVKCPEIAREDRSPPLVGAPREELGQEGCAAHRGGPNTKEQFALPAGRDTPVCVTQVVEFTSPEV